MLAWGESRQSVRDLESTAVLTRRNAADSAFRFATELVPDSGGYWLDYGRFVRFTSNSARRDKLQEMFAQPASRALAAGDPVLAAALFDEQGMFAFRNYELEANRTMAKNRRTEAGIALPRSAETGAGVMDAWSIERTEETARTTVRDEMARVLEQTRVALSPPSGADKLSAALSAFGRAVGADFSNARARRHMAMTLAVREDWTGMRALALRAIDRDSGDVQAWLVRGIASQRLENYPDAAMAFDAGMRLMTDSAQRAFTDLSRLLTPNQFANSSRFPDSITFARLDSAAQRRWQARYWRAADPRVRTNMNEAFLEYLARVAYADLRYGYEEQDVVGSASDRGLVYIRFGPPDHVYGPGDAIWTYRTGRIFYFRTGLTFANASFMPRERQRLLDSILIVDPVGWDNMPLVRSTYPMRMRVARFRAGADSMDAIVTAAVPVRSFLGDADLAGKFPIEVQIEVNDSASRVVGRELRTSTVSRDSLPASINGTWVRRIGRGSNTVRVDAEQQDVRRAASAAVDAPVDTLAGFGMSDVLFGTNPQRIGGTDPQRWRDVSIAPNSGAFRWDQPLGLIWETYELAVANTGTRYRTTITLERTFKSTLKGFVARIAANVKNVLEQDGSGTGRVKVSYEQTRPASAVVTDFLSISLSGAVPGPYRIEIEIADLISGRTVKRSSDFVLVQN